MHIYILIHIDIDIDIHAHMHIQIHTFSLATYTHTQHTHTHTSGPSRKALARCNGRPLTCCPSTCECGNPFYREHILQRTHKNKTPSCSWADVFVCGCVCVCVCVVRVTKQDLFQHVPGPDIGVCGRGKSSSYTVFQCACVQEHRIFKTKIDVIK